MCMAQLPDLPVLTDGKTLTFENWLMAMQDKMTGNEDYYNTPTLQMGYIWS